jgi:predicted Na+-dependent transporter
MISYELVLFFVCAFVFVLGYLFGYLTGRKARSMEEQKNGKG